MTFGGALEYKGSVKHMVRSFIEAISEIAYVRTGRSSCIGLFDFGG